MFGEACSHPAGWSARERPQQRSLPNAPQSRGTRASSLHRSTAAPGPGAPRGGAALAPPPGGTRQRTAQRQAALRLPPAALVRAPPSGRQRSGWPPKKRRQSGHRPAASSGSPQAAGSAHSVLDGLEGDGAAVVGQALEGRATGLGLEAAPPAGRDQPLSLAAAVPCATSHSKSRRSAPRCQGWRPLLRLACGRYARPAAPVPSARRRTARAPQPGRAGTARVPRENIFWYGGSELPPQGRCIFFSGDFLNNFSGGAGLTPPSTRWW